MLDKVLTNLQQKTCVIFENSSNGRNCSSVMNNFLSNFFFDRSVKINFTVLFYYIIRNNKVLVSEKDKFDESKIRRTLKTQNLNGRAKQVWVIAGIRTPT